MEKADKKVALASKAIASNLSVTGSYFPSSVNSSGTSDVDKLATDYDGFSAIVRDCRYFFSKDTLASTVIKKMVDIAINDIIVSESSGISKTEFQVYNALRKDVLSFLKDAAVELLISGLVVPEITLTQISKDELRSKGVQRLDTLLYPTEMYIRDSEFIDIKRPFISAKESYFLVIPEEAIFFIQNKGMYSDGSFDKRLYKEIVDLYPEFVNKILNNEKKILLDNPLIIKLNNFSFTPYPASYLYTGLESFKHKRNMRRMDYSIAARVISAILHVSVGSDEYPLTEDQQDALTDLEQKFKWRENIRKDDVERVFALFTNHTVKMEWVFPDISPLMDEKKYIEVNKDIIQALGFPRVLITGEADRSFAADPEIVTLSPLSTLKALREKLIPVVEHIFREVKEQNKFTLKATPTFRFQPINLMSLSLFFTGLKDLYDSGNLSRESYAESYGFDFTNESNKRTEEKDKLKELGLDEFAPLPHSNAPEKSPGAPLGNKNGEQKGKGKT